MLPLITFPKDVYTTFFGLFLSITKDIELHCVEHQVMVSTMDAGMVCMINIELNIRPEFPAVMKIPIEEIAKLGPKEDVILYKDGNQVIVKVGSVKHKYTTLSDDNVKTTPFRDMNYVGSADITKEQLMEILSINKKIESKKDRSNFIRYTLHDNRLHVIDKNNSTEIDSMEVVYTGEKCSSLFGTDYLVDILSYISVFETFKIYMGNDFPMRLDMNSSIMNVKVLLAPRFDTDE